MQIDHCPPSTTQHRESVAHNEIILGTGVQIGREPPPGARRPAPGPGAEMRGGPRTVPAASRCSLMWLPREGGRRCTCQRSPGATFISCLLERPPELLARGAGRARRAGRRERSLRSSAGDPPARAEASAASAARGQGNSPCLQGKASASSPACAHTASACPGSRGGRRGELAYLSPRDRLGRRDRCLPGLHGQGEAASGCSGLEGTSPRGQRGERMAQAREQRARGAWCAPAQVSRTCSAGDPGPRRAGTAPGLPQPRTHRIASPGCAEPARGRAPGKAQRSGRAGGRAGARVPAGGRRCCPPPPPPQASAAPK